MNSLESAYFLFVCSPTQNKRISMIVNLVFSKPQLNSVLKSQSAAMVHKKPKLQTCLKVAKFKISGRVIEKPAKSLECIL